MNKEKLQSKLINWIGHLERPRNYYVSYTILFAIFFAGAEFAFLYFGKSFLWAADGLSQHYPSLLYTRRWIREIARSILVDHTFRFPMWDMSIGFGQDFQDAFSFRPINFLFALVPESGIELFLLIRVILYLYLCGLCFSLLIRRFHWDGYAGLVGSMVYTFCGYSLYYACRHTFFMELMCYLPLLFLGIEHILEKKKPWLFLAVVALCGMSNFTFLYMIILPAVIYACIRYFHMDRQRSVRDFAGCFLYTALIFIWGVGIAAICFVPGIIRLFNSARVSGASFGSYLHFDWNYYYQLLTGFLTTNKIGLHGFLGFSGIAVLCICLLFMRKDRQARQMKIGILAGLPVFCIPIMVLLFNGFMGKTNRWTFIFAMMVALTVAAMLPRLFTMQAGEQKQLRIAVIVFSVFEIGLYLFAGKKMEYSYLLLMIMALLVLAGGQMISGHPYRIRAVILGFVFLDISLMAWSLYAPSGQNYIGEFVDAGSVEAEADNSSIVMMENNSDTSVFRLDVIFPSYAMKYRYKNYGLRSDYNGISSYFSFTGERVVDYSSELGNSQQSIPFQILDFDQRTVLNELAGVKYVTVAESQVAQVPYGYIGEQRQLKTYLDGTEENVFLYVNQYYLPIMYTYDTYITRDVYDGLEPNMKEQAMLQGIVLNETLDGYPQTELEYTGKTVETKEELLEQIKENIDPEWIEVTEDGLLVKKDNSSVWVSCKGWRKSETYLLWKNILYTNLTAQEERAYGLKENSSRYQEAKYDNNHFLQNENRISTIIVSVPGVEKRCELLSDAHQYYRDAKDLLVNLGYSEQAKDGITIQFTQAGFYSFDDMKVICQPMNQYVDRVSALAADPVEDITIDGNVVTAHTEPSGDRILCIALPYSIGWSATINGEPVEILEGNRMYMAIPIKAGYNEIELRYETPGIRIGAIISLASLLILAVMIPIWRKRNIRRKVR